MIDLLQFLAGIMYVLAHTPWTLFTGAGLAIFGYSWSTKVANTTTVAAAHINLLQTEKVDRDGAIPFTGAATVPGAVLGYVGATGSVKTFFYQADALADDGTVALPESTSGMCFVTCNAEGGMWLVQTSGACTKIAGTTNTDAADTDAKLDVYDGGDGAIVKNRLAATGEIRIIYFYN